MKRTALFAATLACLFLFEAKAQRMVSEIPPSSVTVRYANDSKITLPVLITENGILFQARVNDAPDLLYFTIDSGSASTYLDTQTAKRLGLTPSGEGSVKGAGEGAVPVQHLKNVRFELPGLTTVHPEINTTDLSGLEKEGWGHPVSGFFGYDFIRQLVMTVDYDNALLTLTDLLKFKYDGSGEILPIEFRTKRPYVPGTIKVPGVPAKKALFMVDSGSSDGVNHNLIRKSTGPLRATQAGVGLGQATEAVVGRVEYFQLGRFVLRGAPSLPWGDEEGESTGQIGSAVLKKFKIIFDYSKSQLILEPGKTYDEPFPPIANGPNPAVSGPDATSSNDNPGTKSARNALAMAPIEIYQKLPFVEVRVAGVSRPLVFLIDTAFAESVIGRERVRDLGLKANNEGSSGSDGAKKQYVNQIAMTLGGEAVGVQRLSVLGLSGSIEAVGRPFDGVLGSDFFDHLVVEIDHDAQVLRIYDPATFSYDGVGEALPLAVKDGTPYIAAKLKLTGTEETQKEYKLDSGTADAINDDLFKSASTVNRGGLPDLGRAERFQIGSFMFTGANGAAGDPIIGQDILQRFTVTFDYPHKKVYFEKNRHFDDGFIFDMSGLDLGLTADLKNIAIQQVFPGTPAEQAGLQKGDVITGVEGQPAAELGLDRVIRLFHEPHAYDVTVMRGPKLLHAHLQLRKLL